VGFGVEVLERAWGDACPLDELFHLVRPQPYDPAHLVSGELAGVDKPVEGAQGYPEPCTSLGCADPLHPSRGLLRLCALHLGSVRPLRVIGIFH
jgi:hypothetical protein